MMKRTHDLQFRTETKLVMLPSLYNYLKLLELPNLELETIVRQELEENPLLEEVQPDAEDGEPAVPEKETDRAREKNDLSLVELFAEGTQTTYEGGGEDEFDPLDNVPAEEDRLYDHLMRQAGRKLKDRELDIAELVIANIEEDGYLALPPEELTQDDYCPDEIQNVIKKIQRFDPVGCAWRDMREPLLMQLESLGYDPDSLECCLIRDHLKDLRSNQVKFLTEKFGIDDERLKKAVKVIMKLDPKPGWRYSNFVSKYIIPDFTICWQDNQLVAAINDEHTSRIRIKSQYLEMLKNPKGVPREELEFVRKKAQAARELIVAIEKRRKTLHRILNALLEYQTDFFEKGYSYLKPITMTDFAHQLGVHPSTISRAIANKYLESPWGIHRIKYFFTVPVGQNGQTDKRIIFDKIREMIDNEDKTTPLSDNQIAKKLSREGIIISRRTVTKYRELVNIPSHQYRRKI